MFWLSYHICFHNNCRLQLMRATGIPQTFRTRFRSTRPSRVSWQPMRGRCRRWKGQVSAWLMLDTLHQKGLRTASMKRELPGEDYWTGVVSHCSHVLITCLSHPFGEMVQLYNQTPMLNIVYWMKYPIYIHFYSIWIQHSHYSEVHYLCTGFLVSFTAQMYNYAAAVCMWLSHDLGALSHAGQLTKVRSCRKPSSNRSSSALWKTSSPGWMGLRCNSTLRTSAKTSPQSPTFSRDTLWVCKCTYIDVSV